MGFLFSFSYPSSFPSFKTCLNDGIMWRFIMFSVMFLPGTNRNRKDRKDAMGASWVLAYSACPSNPNVLFGANNLKWWSLGQQANGCYQWFWVNGILCFWGIGYVVTFSAVDANFCRHENNERSGWFWRSALIIGLCMVDMLWEVDISLALEPKPT